MFRGGYTLTEYIYSCTVSKYSFEVIVFLFSPTLYFPLHYVLEANVLFTDYVYLITLASS